MRSATATFVAIFAATWALAQTLPPSPTASVGCEPHGDHWHCDGPATATITNSLGTSSTAHDDHEENETLPPSPTESVGCEPHGDHWHCDGPASVTSTAAATETTHDHDDDEDDHSDSTGALPPSPTESVGCHSHGDHWHCDGPAITSSSTVAASTSTSASVSAPFLTSAASSIPTAGVGKLFVNGIGLIGGMLLALDL
ncbi:hypothetical protein SAMD00023353_6500520 [Rosellinia necatrix]|uniref:Uncharacterized protein n=1 Tax=Rosellinia necatrix TaxID=77044 RepID=A0A1S8AAF0_ROSNE|nr:hypothetical protein SAMD00023353_6500520 [Rosellinia necatrix]